MAALVRFGLVLLALSMVIPWTPGASATQSQCANVALAGYGGPTQVTPYADEDVGFALTENLYGQGETVAIFLDTGQCEPAVFTVPANTTMQSTLSQVPDPSQALPMLP